MSYVLTVIRPPIEPATFGRATTLDPVTYAATAAKRLARRVLVEEGVPTEEAREFGLKLVLAANGEPVPHKGTGLVFRIDPADNAPHPCPCGQDEDDPCGRLVLPGETAYSHDPDAYCQGCYTWDHNTVQCLPAHSGHQIMPPIDLSDMSTKLGRLLDGHKD